MPTSPQNSLSMVTIIQRLRSAIKMKMNDEINAIKKIYYQNTRVQTLTSHVNNLNKYKFVTMAKTTIKIIKSDEAGFKIRTKNRPTRGKYR